MRHAIALALLLVGAVSAPAQTLKRDSATGNYHLTYTDFEGKTHTVVVEARDRVAPALFVALESSPSATVYRYELRHLISPRAKTPIFAIRVPCGQTASVSAPPSWNAVRRGEDSFCRFSGRGVRLKPGESVQGLNITTPLLPTIGEVRVIGSAQGVVWASEDVPDEAARLSHTVDGRDGGWYALPAVVPGRHASALSTPVVGLNWLAADLAQACKLEWIASAGVCNGLRAKLANARTSVDGRNLQAARGMLDAFLKELSAQRGKHVDENAFALLEVIAQETRRRL